MLKEWFGTSALLDVPIAVMVFFVTVFVAVLVWVLSRRRGAYERVSRLPLEDGERL